MSRRDAEKREERRERRQFEDELDLLKRRRYRVQERGPFVTTEFVAQMVSRYYGGPVYEQDYRQKLTTRALMTFYARRERIFGSAQPTYHDIVWRAGYVRKYRSLQDWYLALSARSWFGGMLDGAAGDACEACGVRVAHSGTRTHLENDCAGAGWKRKQLLSELGSQA